MSRLAVAVAVALLLHALAWCVLARLPPPPPLPPAPGPLEVEWLAPAAPPAPATVTAPPVAAVSHEVRRRGAHHHDNALATTGARSVATGPRAAASRAVEPAASRAVEPAASRAVEPTAPPAGNTDGVDLFPRALLDRYGQAGASSVSPPRGKPDAGPTREQEQREVATRVRGWLDGDNAAAQTSAGRITPEWRRVERELGQSFHPPVEVVHETPDRTGARVADRLRSWVQQNLAVIKRGEEGVRRGVVPGSQDIESAADPSQQGFAGAPEGLNLRSLPLAQQFAAQAAAGEPTAWLVTEIEVTLDGERRVVRACVVTPSGRRRFDRYALAAVEARVAAGGAPSSTSRWRVAAAHSVAPLTALGASFDILMLFDKKMREQFQFQYPLQSQVQSHVSLVWARRD